MERAQGRFTLYAFTAMVLFVTVAHLWPRLFVGFTSGSHILPLGPSGEGYYLAPVQQARLGRTNYNHSIYYELRDQPDQPAMEANIRAVAWMANHTDLTFTQFTSLIYIFCIVLLTALFGWIIYRQTANGIWTIALSATAMLTPDYLILRAHPLKFFIDRMDLPFNSELLGKYLPYMRPMNPQASSVILLFLCGIIAGFLPVAPGEKPRSGIARFAGTFIAILLGLLLALSIHTYYYLAVYCISLLGLLFAVTLWRREMRHLAPYAGAGWAGGVIVSLPFMFDLMAQISGGLALHPSAAVNAVATRIPAFTYGGFLCLMTGLYLAREIRDGDTRAVFPMILNLAVPVAENSHITTGIMIEPFQVGWYYAPPALISAAAWWIGSKADLRDERFWGIRSSIAVLALAIIFGAIQLRYSMQVDFTRFGEERDLAPVFSQTLPLDDGECVVLASEHVSDLVRLYTPCRVYGQFSGVRGTGPASRNPERLQRIASAFGVNWDRALREQSGYSGWSGPAAAGYLVGPRAFPYLFMNRRPLSANELAVLRAEYEGVEQGCIDHREPFRLDYVITLGDEDAYLRPSRFCQEIELVGRAGVGRLYRVTGQPREK